MSRSTISTFQLFERFQAEESRVLQERAERFRWMAEMIDSAFRRDNTTAMKAFGTNAVAHVAREVLRSAPETREPKRLGHRYTGGSLDDVCRLKVECGQPRAAHTEELK